MPQEEDLVVEKQNRLTEIGAVITVLAADREIYDLVSPFISVVDTSIDWDGIFALSLTSGQRAICQWAYCVFEDQVPSGFNPFDIVLGADPVFKRAILKALKMRWCV